MSAKKKQPAANGKEGYPKRGAVPAEKEEALSKGAAGAEGLPTPDQKS